MKRFEIPIVLLWGTSISYIIYNTHLTNIQKQNSKNFKKVIINPKKEDYDKTDFNPFRAL